MMGYIEGILVSGLKFIYVDGMIMGCVGKKVVGCFFYGVKYDGFLLVCRYVDIIVL